MADHTEAVQVEFDPRVVSYDDLFAASFLPSVKHRGPAHSVQYKSAVWWHDDRQRAVAEGALAAAPGMAIDVGPAAVFYQVGRAADSAWGAGRGGRGGCTVHATVGLDCASPLSLAKPPFP